LAHLSLDRAQQFLVAASIFGGAIVVLPITDQGHVAPPVDHAELPGPLKIPTGVIPEPISSALPRTDPRFGCATPHSVRADYSNRYLIAGDIGMGALDVVPFNSRSGALGQPRRFSLGRDAAPRTVELHPNGHTLYTSNELESTMSVYEFESGSGTVEEVQHVPTLPSGMPLSTDWQISSTSRQMAGGAVIDAPGRFLYVSNRGTDNSIATFAIDGRGRLERVENMPVPGVFPAEIAISPDGRLLYAPNTHSSNVAAFAVNPVSGKLSALRVTAVPSPTSVAFIA
jgi:6-phosphogluconolactonase